MCYLKFCPTVILALFLVNQSSAICQGDFWVKPGVIGDTIVNAIAFKSVDTVLAATNNGIYQSTDKGVHWTPIGLTDSIVTSVIINTKGQVFAGCASQFWGNMFRSADGGAHWTKVAMDTLGGGIWPITCMAVETGGHIFAGGFYYVFRSTDDGAQWTHSLLSTTSFFSIAAIVPIPSGPIFAGDPSGVYRSSDDGQSWERKITGLGDTTVAAIGFDQTGYVYAGIWGMGVYRSPDNGENWERADNGVTNHYISSLASNILDLVFVGTNGGGVFQTNDNGDHWQAMNSGLTNTDIKCLAMSPDGYLYTGTKGGGVFKSVNTTLGVKRISGNIPNKFALRQNYPNPFNPSTIIKYTLPKASPVTLKIYDILGRELKTLVNGSQEAGYKSVQFNASALPSGIYFYRLQAGAYVETKKLLLLK